MERLAAEPSGLCNQSKTISPSEQIDVTGFFIVVFFTSLVHAEYNYEVERGNHSSLSTQKTEIKGNMFNLWVKMCSILCNALGATKFSPCPTVHLRM